MKKALMTQYPCARGRAFVCKNIGDYIQSVASRQYVGIDCEYIEQEEAGQYFPDDKDKSRLIMNGWYQWRTENWPPSEYIVPLLVSMHISPLKQDQLLSRKGIEFLKKNSPVGCRDQYTKKLLEAHGIKSYFSACVTLTLGKNYYVPFEQREGIYFVDPYFDIPPLYEEIGDNKIINENQLNEFISCYSLHSDIINKLAENDFFRDFSPSGFLDRNLFFYRKFYKATCFYKIYSKLFSDDLLLSAHYITHWLDVNMSTETNDTLLDCAENLVKKYAKAKMVITSRIHAGLPCLGLETPVVFIANKEVVSEEGSFNVPGRLGGILELFRCLNLENDNFTSTDEVLVKINRFDKETKFANTDDWRQYAEKLDKQLSAFMADDFNLSRINDIRNMY